jgi:hypothetical protein
MAQPLAFLLPTPQQERCCKKTHDPLFGFVAAPILTFIPGHICVKSIRGLTCA